MNCRTTVSIVGRLVFLGMAISLTNPTASNAQQSHANIIDQDRHVGWTGSTNWGNVYRLTLKGYRPGHRYIVRSRGFIDGMNGTSRGEVTMGRQGMLPNGSTTWDNNSLTRVSGVGAPADVHTWSKPVEDWAKRQTSSPIEWDVTNYISQDGTYLVTWTYTGDVAGCGIFVTSVDLLTIDSAGIATSLRAPSNLRARVENRPCVKLTWKNNDPNASGFEIGRSDGDTLWFAQIDSIPRGKTLYRDTMPAEGMNYYRVRAVGQSDFSPYSNIASANVPPAPQVPLPPPPGNLHAQFQAPLQVALAWVNNDHDGGTRSFRVERRDAGGLFAQRAEVLASQTSYIDTVPTRGALYFYRVRAVGGSGTSAYATDSVSVPAALDLSGDWDINYDDVNNPQSQWAGLMQLIKIQGGAGTYSGQFKWSHNRITGQRTDPSVDGPLSATVNGTQISIVRIHPKFPAVLDGSVDAGGLSMTGHGTETWVQEGNKKIAIAWSAKKRHR